MEQKDEIILTPEQVEAMNTVMSQIDELYKWLNTITPSKKTYDLLLIDMKNKFSELGILRYVNDLPSSMWMLALNYLNATRRETKSILGNKDCTVIIYK